MAAPTFVNSSSITGASGTTASFTKPASVTTNDVMVIGMYKENNGALTLPSGWTQIGQITNATVSPNFTLHVLRKVDDGTAGPYAISWTGSVWRVGGLTAYRDVDATVGTPTTIDVSGSANSSSASGAAVAPTVTTTRNNDLCAVVAGNVTGGTWTAGTGTTNLRVNTGDDLGMGDSVQATLGATGTRALNCSASNAWNAWQVAIFSASEGGAVDPFPAGYRLRRQQPPNWSTLLAR